MNHNWQRKWHNTEERTAIHSLSFLATQFDDVPASSLLCENKSYIFPSDRERHRPKYLGTRIILTFSIDCAPCGTHGLLTSGGPCEDAIRLSVFPPQLYEEEGLFIFRKCCEKGRRRGGSGGQRHKSNESKLSK